MIRVTFLAALLLAAPLAAQETGQEVGQESGPGPAATADPMPVPRLSLEQRMLLRCSAAFALTANRQQAGEGWALAFPPLAERGREFFVVATARLADETGFDVPAFEPLLRAEAEALLVGEAYKQIMPVCISLLPPERQG